VLNGEQPGLLGDGLLELVEVNFPLDVRGNTFSLALVWLQAISYGR